MDYTITQNLITGAVTSFGGSVLAIITATLALGLAYLVFRFGYKKLKSVIWFNRTHGEYGDWSKRYWKTGRKRKDGSDIYFDPSSAFKD